MTPQDSGSARNVVNRRISTTALLNLAGVPPGAEVHELDLDDDGLHVVYTEPPGESQ